MTTKEALRLARERAKVEMARMKAGKHVFAVGGLTVRVTVKNSVDMDKDTKVRSRCK